MSIQDKNSFNMRVVVKSKKMISINRDGEKMFIDKDEVDKYQSSEKKRLKISNPKKKGVFGVIYKTVCVPTGKIYIGQTVRDSDNYLGSGGIIRNAIRKYGKLNFRKEILFECHNQKQLDIWERYFIKKFNSIDRNIGETLKSDLTMFCCYMVFNSGGIKSH